MNSKEIELVLKARLEASDASSDAMAIGSQISAALETAFNGLGERLAHKFAEEFKNKLGSSDFFSQLGSSGTSSSRSSGGPEMLTGSASSDARNNSFDSRANEAFVRSTPQRISGGQAVPNYGQFSVPQANEQFNPRGGLTSQINDTFKSLGADPKWLKQLGIGQEADEMDRQLRQHQIFKTVRGINPNVDPAAFGQSQDSLKKLKEELTAFATNAGQKLAEKDFDKDIKELTSAIKDMSKDYRAAIAKPVGQRTRSDELLIEEFEGKSAKKTAAEQGKEAGENLLSDLAKKIKGIDTGAEAQPWYNNRNTWSGVGKGMAVAGEAMGFAGNLRYMGLRGEAGAAEANNMGARDFLSGDYQKVLATQMGGGYGAMRTAASASTGLGIAGNLVSGIGQTIFGAASSETGIGAMIGLNGVRQTMSSGKDIMEYESAVAQKMRQDQNLQYEKNKEQLDIYGKARANVQGAYNDAIGMGSEEYSDFLTGGGKNGIFDRSRNSGVSRAAQSAGLRTYAQGMGGVYNGLNTMNLPGVRDAIVAGNTLKGQGFANIEDVASGMFQGSSMGSSPETDRARAINEAGERYQAYRGTGVDEAGAVGVLGSMGARARGGLDMGFTSGYIADTAIAYGAANGMGQKSGQLNFLNRMETNFLQGANTGSGAMGIAKIRAIDNFEKSLGPGKTLSKAQRAALQTGELGEEGMASIMGLDLGGKDGAANLKTVRDKLSSFNQDIKDQGVEMYTNMVGGKDKDLGAMFYASEVGGAKTYEEKMKGAQFALSRDGKPVVPITGFDSRDGQKMVPGKREQNQDNENEMNQLINGMKTLNEGFNALQSAAKEAAIRLNEVANVPIATAEDRQSIEDDYANNGVGGALGRQFRRGVTNTFGYTGWGEDNFKKNNMGRNGGTKGQAPKTSKPGSGSE